MVSDALTATCGESYIYMSYICKCMLDLGSSRFYIILCRFYKNVSQRRGMLVRGMLVGEKRQKKRNDSAC